MTEHLAPVKRVEIVVEGVHETEVVRRIARAGIDGWTLHRHAAGTGSRGARDGEGLTDVLQNIVFVVAAKPEQAEQLALSLRPLLQRFGGVCLISDAQWLMH